MVEALQRGSELDLAHTEQIIGPEREQLRSQLYLLPARVECKRRVRATLSLERSS
jgi:hypothetical protein